MGLFKSKEEKKAKKEANAFFLGQTLQAIGRIPAGKNVGISLEPERQVLKIQYEETAITLPYSRIISFMLEDETKLSDKCWITCISRWRFIWGYRSYCWSGFCQK